MEVSRGMSLSGEYYASEGNLLRLTLGNFDYHNNCFKDDKSKDNLYFNGSVKKEFVLNKDDIITPLTEQAIGLLGSTAKIPCSGKYIQSQDVALIKCNEKLHPDFAFYLIPSKMVRNQLSAAAQQTKIRHTSPDKIKDCTVFIPEYSSQEKIGKLLSRIDEKISINRQINRNLEELAKQIYDYWFVQFDFPNEEGKPYKSSGGKMVFNPILKKEIPDNWDVKSINDFCSSYRGVSYDKSDLLDGPENGVLVLRGNNIDGNTLVYDDNVAYVPPSFVESEQKIKKHDIIMTMSSGSKEHVGKCTMFQADSEHTYGAFMTKFTPNPECPFFAYRSMLSDFFKAKIKYICGGTGINNLTNQTFDEILFSFPAKEVLETFEKKLTPIYEEVGKNNDEILRLTALRDSLLPLLMNGQVTLNSCLSHD